MKEGKKWWQAKPWAEQTKAQKLGMIAVWCLLAVVVLGLIFGGEEKAEKPEPSPSLESVTQAIEVIDKAAAPGREPEAAPAPFTLDEARAFAKHVKKITDEAEIALQDGIATKDGDGIQKFVVKPLDGATDAWRGTVGQGKLNLDYFDACRVAANALHSLAKAAFRDPSVQRQKDIRRYEGEYNENKASCQKQIATTNAQIKAADAKKEAEMVKKYGGKDCLTVYGLDPETQEVKAQPKPSHCKK